MEEREEEFSLHFLDPCAVRIFTNPHGVLCMECGGVVYWKIDARRAFPYTYEDEYIFLYNYNDEEVGAVRDLRHLGRHERHAVRELLRRRYFTREIREVYEIKDKFSVLIFRVRTDLRQSVEFTVGRPKDNIFRSRGGGFLIRDIDGNLYHVKDIRVLSPHDVIRLERYC